MLKVEQRRDLYVNVFDKKQYLVLRFLILDKVK